MQQITCHNKSTLVQAMAWCCQATSYYLSQWWSRSLSYSISRLQWVKILDFGTNLQNKIYTIKPENFSLRLWKIQLTEQINSLWPSDARWRQRFGSTLAQVMDCCLTAPTHYLNQCWLIISEVQWHSYSGNFTTDASTINHYNLFKSTCLKFQSNFPGTNELSFQSKMTD